MFTPVLRALKRILVDGANAVMLLIRCDQYNNHENEVDKRDNPVAQNILDRSFGVSEIIPGSMPNDVIDIER